MKTPALFTLRGAFCALITICAISVAKADESKKPEKTPDVPKKYDLNQDGKLDESEKAAWEADKAKKKAEWEAKRLEKFDKNKDGKLDESELAAEKALKQEMAEKKKAEQEKKKAAKEAAGTQ